MMLGFCVFWFSSFFLSIVFQPDVEMEAVSHLTSPPAGLGTLDPLPLRQDQWPPNSVSEEQVPLASAHQERSATPPLVKSAKNFSMPWWSPSRRIQGTLKDPEFQHNGGFCVLTGCLKLLQGGNGYRLVFRPRQC